MTIWERWASIPPTVREPIKSGFLATSFALQTGCFVLLGAAVQAGKADSPADTLVYFAGHWWGVAIGIILPAAYRARQGRVAAENTVSLPNGVSAVLIPPKGT